MRTVDLDRNVRIPVGSGYGNLDILKEVPCWWLRTRRCVFLSGFFRGESRVVFMIARIPEDSDAR